MKGQIFDLPEHMETIMDILEAVRTETEKRLLEGFYNEDIFEVMKMKRQMVVRIEGRDYSAVSNAEDLRTAKTECAAQLQQLIFNTLGVMPQVGTLISHMRYFKPI